MNLEPLDVLEHDERVNGIDRRVRNGKGAPIARVQLHIGHAAAGQIIPDDVAACVNIRPDSFPKRPRRNAKQTPAPYPISSTAFFSGSTTRPAKGRAMCNAKS